MSSPTRPKILDRLRDGPKTTGELASRFPKLTRFAVMQHLGVLTKAHLVLVRREGRFRFNHLNAGSVVKISDSIFGNVSPDQAAKMDEGWRLLFDEGLRPYAERDDESDLTKRAVRLPTIVHVRVSLRSNHRGVV